MKLLLFDHQYSNQPFDQGVVSYHLSLLFYSIVSTLGFLAFQTSIDYINSIPILYYQIL